MGRMGRKRSAGLDFRDFKAFNYLPDDALRGKVDYYFSGKWSEDWRAYREVQVMLCLLNRRRKG